MPPSARVALFVLSVALSLSATAATKTWTGGGTTFNWSEAANWSGGVPAAGDVLVFPDNPVQNFALNDLAAGTAYQSISIGKPDYDIGGNGIQLSAGLTVSSGTQVNITLPIELTASQTFAVQSQTTFQGDIELHSFDLTVNGPNVLTRFNGVISGTGNLALSNVRLSGNNTLTGTTTIKGVVSIFGSQPDSPVVVEANAKLFGRNASLGSLTSNGDVAPGAQANSGFAVIDTKNLSLQSGTVLILDFNGLTAGTNHDQLRVAGTVTIGSNVRNATATLPSFAMNNGDVVTLIDNDGNDAVSGTFLNAPEGALATFPNSIWRISYAGGDGNDVTMTCVSVTKTWNGSVSNLWSGGANWTPNGAPVAGDRLLFPNGAANQSTTNDLAAGTMFRALAVTGGAYTIGGNTIGVTSGISTVASSTLQVNAPLLFGATQTFTFLGATALNGAIDLNGFDLTIGGGPTAINGAMSGSGNVTIASDTILFGTGSLANATINGALAPGATPNGTAIVGTKNLTWSAGSFARFDIAGSASGSGYDQLRVTGSVTIHPTTSLVLTQPFATATVGQVFTLIDNDGIDAITGTFAGRPQNYTFTSDMRTFVLSYTGGDGNDLTITCTRVPKVWTGAVNALWSVGGNWSDGIAPAGGDKLVFPAGAANTQTTNDLPAATMFDSLDIVGPGYVIDGNIIGLTNAAVALFAPQSVIINAPLKLGATTSFTFTQPSTINGSIDRGPQGLTINGGGGARFNGSINGTHDVNTGGTVYLGGNNTYTGRTFANHRLAVNGSQPLSRVIVNPGAFLFGSGGLLGITEVAGKLAPGPNEPPASGPNGIGTLSTKNLSLSANAALHAGIESTGHDRVNVVGSVTIGANVQLALTLETVPAKTQVFTLIDNDGTDAISGAFANAAEGASLTVNGHQFAISYVGGSGNDLTLTALTGLEPTTTSLRATRTRASIGTTVQFIATVTPAAIGSVQFFDGETAIGSATLGAGEATISTDTLAIGVHTIRAVYSGNATHTGSSSEPLTITIDARPVYLSMVSSSNPSAFGAPVTFTVFVNPIDAAGSVTIADGSNALGTMKVLNGTVSLTVSTLTPGTHDILATYAAGAGEQAASASLTQNVGRIPTSIALTASPNPATNGGVIVLTAAVTPAATGSVEFFKGATSLGIAQLANGVATSSTPAITGSHPILATYAGDATHAPSTSPAVNVTVNPAPCATAVPQLLEPAPDSQVSGQVTFRWTAVPGATHYRVFYDLGKFPMVGAALTTATEATLSPIAGTFRWFVRAYMAFPCANVESERRVLTNGPLPSCPTTAPALHAPLFGPNGIGVTLSWTPVADAVQYQVFMKTNNDLFADLGVTKDTQLTTTLPPEGGSAEWYVLVFRAGCSPAKSVHAGFGFAKQYVCPTDAPSALAPYDGATNIPFTYDFRWTPVTADGNVQYEVWLTRIGSNAPVLLGKTTDTHLTTTMPDDGPAYPRDRKWWVEATFPGRSCARLVSPRNAFGLVLNEQCAEVTIPQLVSPPENTQTKDAFHVFTWTAVPNATSYQLWLQTQNGTKQHLKTVPASQLSASAFIPIGASNWWVAARIDGCQPSLSLKRKITRVFCKALAATPLTPAPAAQNLPSKVQFKWAAVAPAIAGNAIVYELRVEGRNAGTVIASTSDTSAAMFLQPGSYKWTVFAFEPALGCSGASAPRVFTVAPASTSCLAPSPPLLSGPAKVKTGTSYTIYWSPVANAGEYEVLPHGNAIPIRTTSTWITLPAPNQPSYLVNSVRAVSSCNGQYSPLATLATVITDEPVFSHVDTQDGTYTTTLTNNGFSSPRDVASMHDVTLTSSTDQPWLTVSPSTVTVSHDQQVELTLHASLADLGLGTHHATIIVRRSDGEVTSIPTAVHIVPDVTTTARSTPPRSAWIIPIAGHISQWRSDVRVANTGATPATYELTFTPAGEDNARAAVLDLDAGQLVAIDDVIANWFGLTQSYGSLVLREIDGDTPTTVTSRTYSHSAEGTAGEFVPAVRIGDTDVLTLLPVTESEEFRANLGLVEGTGNPATARIHVYDESGSQLMEMSVDLAPNETKQLNAFLREHGITGTVRVDVDGVAAAYASVVENATNDLLFVSGVPHTDTATTLYFPPGADAVVFNPATIPVEISVGGSIAAGAMKRISLTAPAKITASHGVIAVRALTPEDATSLDGDPLQFAHVHESPHYRSDLGVVEMSGNSTTVEISAGDATTTLTLQANELVVIESVLRRLGVNAHKARVTVRVIGGAGSVAGYVSLVDRRTGDSSYIKVTP